MGGSMGGSMGGPESGSMGGSTGVISGSISKSGALLQDEEHTPHRHGGAVVKKDKRECNSHNRKQFCNQNSGCEWDGTRDYGEQCMTKAAAAAEKACNVHNRQQFCKQNSGCEWDGARDRGKQCKAKVNKALRGERDLADLERRLERRQQSP